MNDFNMYEELYGSYVRMDDRFESVHLWSRELALKNAGRWIPELITKEDYLKQKREEAKNSSPESKIDEIVSKIEGGSEMMRDSSVFNVTVTALAHGEDPYQILAKLCKIIDTNNENFKKYMESDTRPIELNVPEDLLSVERSEKIDKLRRLRIAHECAINYDYVPESSEAEELLDNIMPSNIKVDKEELESILEEFSGCSPSRITDYIIDLIDEL